MSTWNHYVVADSVESALRALAAGGPQARPIAGGTDLLLEIQQGHTPPVDTLVDLSQIQTLQTIEIREGSLMIGAAASVRRVAEAAEVKTHALALSEACALIGGPQVRNSATLGGNVAHALPAADGMIALTALGAEVEILSLEGTRRAPILSLFAGPGRSTLKTGCEILTRFILPERQAGEGSAFSRVMRPQGVALPVLNLAAWVRRDRETILDCRIVVGPAGPTPRRAEPVEMYLRGKAWSAETAARAVERMRETMRFRASPRRATAEYRDHLAGVLLEKVFQTAWERAEATL